MNVNLQSGDRTWSSTQVQCRPQVGDLFDLGEKRFAVVKQVIQDFRTGLITATIEFEDAETKPQQRDASGGKDVQHQQGSGAGLSRVRGKGAKRKAHPAAD